MAGILVYLPHRPTDSNDVAQELRARGLGGLLDSNVDAIPTEVRKGPDGKPGRLVTFNALGLPNTPREYDAGSQDWRPVSDGLAWVGCVKNEKPFPEELQRRIVIDGQKVVLGDGHEWIVPCTIFVPRRLDIDPKTGAEIRLVKDEHREWVEWSNRIYDQIMADCFAAITSDGYSVTIENGLLYAALTLSKNYRVTREVLALLGLLDDAELTALVLEACGVGYTARMALEKKSADSPSLKPVLS